MKRIILVIVLISISFVFCKKEQPTEFKGIITGADLRMCACCGGYIINIQNAVYRFGSLPENSGIDLSINSFPIYVIVSYHQKPDQCMGDEIIIDKIRKQ
jgi:hypothetical protein